LKIVILTLTSDDLESHIVVNVSSTLTNTTIWFVAALSLIVDVRTYGCTDGWMYTHTTVLLLFWSMSGTTRVSRYQEGKTRKVKANLDSLEQEIVSGSGISWAICKSASHPRQPCQHPTTQFFYRPDALPVAQPTASKHGCMYGRTNIFTGFIRSSLRR